MGKVSFGAIQHEKTKDFIPIIEIKKGKDIITFTANIALGNESDARDFVRQLYSILTGPKKNLEFDNDDLN